MRDDKRVEKMAAKMVAWKELLKVVKWVVLRVALLVVLKEM